MKQQLEESIKILSALFNKLPEEEHQNLLKVIGTLQGLLILESIK